MLSNFFTDHLESLLTKHVGSIVKVNRFDPVGGGSINQAFKISTSAGAFFIKYNSTSRFPGMFEAEAKGLMLLQRTETIGVPGVISTGEAESNSFIILQWLNPGKRIKNFWEHFGQQLAALHRFNTNQFGLDHSNYIGSLPQSNREYTSGADFMINERFIPLVKLAADKGLLDAAETKQFEIFYKKVPDILPNENPVLLHGDLWNGNFLTGPDGNAWIIDPAVYNGYRETDLAMAKLFGGFDPEFYESYDAAFPMQPEWEQRIDFFQLYPLLVHLNLFGSGYRGGVMRVVGKY